MSKLPILVSYAYLKEKGISLLNKHKHRLDILLDSGAYTAHTQGKEILLTDYVHFVKHAFPVTQYISLDVIGSAEQSMSNYLAMLQQGLKPVPVFTRGAPIEDLETYHGTSEFVALGGISLHAGDTPNYVKYFMRHITTQRVHWLGWSDHDFLLHYRPYSYDNSSWSRLRAFEDFVFIYRNKLCFLKRSDLRKTVTRNAEFRAFLSDIAETPFDILNPENHGGAGSIRWKMNTKSYVLYAKLLKRHLNVTMRFATAPDMVEELLEAWERYE